MTECCQSVGQIVGLHVRYWISSLLLTSSSEAFHSNGICSDGHGYPETVKWRCIRRSQKKTGVMCQDAGVARLKGVFTTIDRLWSRGFGHDKRKVYPSHLSSNAEHREQLGKLRSQCTLRPAQCAGQFYGPFGSWCRYLFKCRNSSGLGASQWQACR